LKLELDVVTDVTLADHHDQPWLRAIAAFSG
jgi:hypothetical protein